VANAEDVAEVQAGGATSAFIDRLTLTPKRIEAMADGVATVRGNCRSSRCRHRVGNSRTA
jgi:gamma-glutamyl phosphate reductase